MPAGPVQSNQEESFAQRRLRMDREETALQRRSIKLVTNPQQPAATHPQAHDASRKQEPKQKSDSTLSTGQETSKAEKKDAAVPPPPAPLPIPKRKGRKVSASQKVREGTICSLISQGIPIVTYVSASSLNETHVEQRFQNGWTDYPNRRLSVSNAEGIIRS